jgi:hypothetical protein
VASLASGCDAIRKALDLVSKEMLQPCWSRYTTTLMFYLRKGLQSSEARVAIGSHVNTSILAAVIAQPVTCHLQFTMPSSLQSLVLHIDSICPNVERTIVSH